MDSYFLKKNKNLIIIFVVAIMIVLIFYKKQVSIETGKRDSFYYNPNYSPWNNWNGRYYPYYYYPELYPYYYPYYSFYTPCIEDIFGNINCW